MTDSGRLKINMLEVPDNPEEVYNIFYERGWTDGLPVIPPTEERVTGMLRGTKRDPEEVLGTLPPSGNDATVGLVAVNAVMAGCIPEYMPVLVAAVQALAEPSLGLHNIQATTHPVAPIVIVNGPIRHRIGMNWGCNLFGPANRANATIGRAVRLILLNIGGGLPGTFDLATHGQPSKYSFCIAENEEENPWEPLHVEMGYEKTDSVVTVNGVENPHNINDHTADDAENLLVTYAASIATQGNNNILYQSGEPLLIPAPEHARILANSGYSKAQLKEYIYRNARIPKNIYSKKHQELQFITYGENDLIPVIQKPEDLMVVVAGGAGKHTLFCPTYAIRTGFVTKKIEE